MIASLRNAYLTLAFAVELAMLAGFGFAGWSLGHALWQRAGLALALPAVAIALWAVWAAPKAGARRLKMPALLVFKLALFAAATVAWWVAAQGFVATVFAVLAAISLLAGLAFRRV